MPAAKKSAIERFKETVIGLIALGVLAGALSAFGGDLYETVGKLTGLKSGKDNLPIINPIPASGEKKSWIEKLGLGK